MPQLTSEAAPPRRIPYTVTQEWGVPNGGYGRIIVIDTQHRNEQDMRALGETLRFDTKGDRNAFILVFDNSRAAAMYPNVMNLNDKDGAFYDKHLIGGYTRNINTGFHRLDIALNGYNNSIIQVDY